MGLCLLPPEAKDRERDCFVQNLLATPPSRTSKFILSLGLELQEGGPEKWLVLRGPRSDAGEQSALFF